MATSKNQTNTNSVTQSTSNIRQKEDLPSLKAKIVELERQITEYKTKLDELRRAKATTVVKLEKEYVNTAAPGLNRPEKLKACEKCEELEKIVENERKSNVQLKKLLEQRDSSNGKQTGNSSSCQQCSTFKELLDQEKKSNQQLSEQIINEKKRTEHEKQAKEILDRTLELTNADLNELKSLVEALKIENQQYRSAFDRMKQEHEQKMAELFQREEEAKKQVATWEQMYREWMATMERRVNNLQTTNEELQTWLHEDTQMVANRHLDNSKNKNQRQ